MSGTIIRALPKTFYDFSGLTNPSESVTIPVATSIPIHDYREMLLVLRVHSFNLSNTAGASITLSCYQESLTTDDPASDFYDASSPLVSIGPVAFSSITAPYYTNAAPGFPMFLGSSLRLYLQATQSSGTAANPFYISLSVDISAKAL